MQHKNEEIEEHIKQCELKINTDICLINELKDHNKFIENKLKNKENKIIEN